MPADSPILTIAIPTYNRAAKLQAQLERLVPQLRPEVRLCVYDNASPDHTAEVVAKYRDQGVAYFRAATNCGAGRNFFRCFEECRTEWLWILSDDDPVLDDAATKLLAIINENGYSCDFIHTSTSGCRYASDVVVTEIKSLFQHTTFGGLLWISPGIYRVDSFRSQFRNFNESLSTWAPQVVVMLSLLESNSGNIRLSRVGLFVEPGFPAKWSTLDFIVRVSHAPEYLNLPDHQRLLAERILLECVCPAMLRGLREVTNADQIRKWKRVYWQTMANLWAYNRWGPWRYVMQNWYRSGHRKQCKAIITEILKIRMLQICPVVFFHNLAAIMPMSKDIRDDYEKRDQYVPSV